MFVSFGCLQCDDSVNEEKALFVSFVFLQSDYSVNEIHVAIYELVWHRYVISPVCLVQFVKQRSKNLLVPVRL